MCCGVIAVSVHLLSSARKESNMRKRWVKFHFRLLGQHVKNYVLHKLQFFATFFSEVYLLFAIVES